MKFSNNTAITVGQKLNRINPMNRKTILVLLIAAISAKSWLSYTFMDQQKQINQLQEQLQEAQMKYEIIKNDPLARDAMEAGG